MKTPLILFFFFFCLWFSLGSNNRLKFKRWKSTLLVKKFFSRSNFVFRLSRLNNSNKYFLGSGKRRKLNNFRFRLESFLCVCVLYVFDFRFFWTNSKALSLNTSLKMLLEKELFGFNRTENQASRFPFRIWYSLPSFIKFMSKGPDKFPTWSIYSRIKFSPPFIFVSLE